MLFRTLLREIAFTLVVIEKNKITTNKVELPSQIRDEIKSYLLLTIGDVKIGGQFYFFRSLILVSNSTFSYRE